MTLTLASWRVQDELIEQPSWGGRYLVKTRNFWDGVRPHFMKTYTQHSLA